MSLLEREYMRKSGNSKGLIRRIRVRRPLRAVAIAIGALVLIVGLWGFASTAQDRVPSQGGLPKSEPQQPTQATTQAAQDKPGDSSNTKVQAKKETNEVRPPTPLARAIYSWIGELPDDAKPRFGKWSALALDKANAWFETNIAGKRWRIGATLATSNAGGVFDGQFTRVSGGGLTWEGGLALVDNTFDLDGKKYSIHLTAGDNALQLLAGGFSVQSSDVQFVEAFRDGGTIVREEFGGVPAILKARVAEIVINPVVFMGAAMEDTVFVFIEDYSIELLKPLEQLKAEAQQKRDERLAERLARERKETEAKKRIAEERKRAQEQEDENEIRESFHAEEIASGDPSIDFTSTLGFRFLGPYPGPSYAKRKPGVYLWLQKEADGQFTVVGAGWARSLFEYLIDEGKRQVEGEKDIWVAVLYFKGGSTDTLAALVRKIGRVYKLE